MVQIHSFAVKTLSMVSKEGLQRVDMHYDCERVTRLSLEVYRESRQVLDPVPVILDGCQGTVSVMLPVQTESFEALWRLTDGQGNVVAQTRAMWQLPRHRTMYVMLSSHTDIGLHNSQYIQRLNSSRFLDMAKGLCDETADRPENDRYRYVMEGTWFWNNYGMDRGKAAAKAVVQDYIKQDKLGVCCGVAGNHTQTYGLEELCRSAYEKKRLKEAWDVDSETMTMIDNNGMSMGIISAYVQAGIKNLIFAPNQWNPLPSTIWKMDVSKHAPIWNSDAGGGGARIDIRYDSALPMVFYWENCDGERILVWGSTQYTHGATAFGLYPEKNINSVTIPLIEDCMAKQLPQLDEKYPYDVWLMCCYADDQEPDIRITDSIKMWNEKWQWPKLRTLGDPGEPFRILREKHEQQIPVVRGDIAGGWYQHPVAAPELLAQKFDADRLLPTAEKWATVAAMLDKNYTYPAEDFRRSWDYLLYHDEHSYGTSGYQGRRVYETWMQHRDWIDKAQQTARTESHRALQIIADAVTAREESLVLFNPTALPRQELVETKIGTCLAEIPAFGYRLVAKKDFASPCLQETHPQEPPIIENAYYKLTFAENGALHSIFDKELNRELLDSQNPYGANAILYTRDNHKSFTQAQKAQFSVLISAEKTTVVVKTEIPGLGAEMVMTVTLPNHEKRVDMDNCLYHVQDMVNKNRYYRYLYAAFPFKVENAHRYCNLNGAVAEYAKDVTGYSTDVYMATREWCCAENEDFGVALLMLDSQLMEFDHIHPDKTDFGNAGDGSQMFVYLANDWLQMHTPGGSHLDYRFRFSITSYQGTYRQAGILQMAERLANPVQAVSVPMQTGILTKSAHSFLQVQGGRLLTLKRADDGDGIIARLYTKGENPGITTDFGKDLAIQRVRIDELPLQEADSGSFATYRLGSGAVRLPERPVEVPEANGAPAPIGSVYTGLITEPCAAPGENSGQLYLLWGQSVEEDFSHYKLYRSERSGFTPDETTFVANIQPEEYRVGRYVDTELKSHTCYYYRVCAVNRAGQQSPFSREFGAFTKEEI